MDITGPLFHVASELQLKEIFAQMPIMVLTSTNICLKMNTNALFGTIVVYQVNNIHLKKTFRKCFHTIAPEDNIRVIMVSGVNNLCFKYVLQNSFPFLCQFLFELFQLIIVKRKTCD